jgi:hypothetical protein
LLLTKYADDRIKKNKMGGACDTHGGVVHTEFWRGNLMETGHFENLGVDRTTILKRIFKKEDGNVGWIDLAQDRDRWLTTVNTAIKLRVP